MRILLSLLIAIVLLGGTWAYTRFADSVRAAAVPYVPDFSEGEYSIEIGRTFDCVPDELLESPALLVRFRGKEIYVEDKAVAASVPIRIENVPNVENGQNDFNVTANFESAEGSLAAMRIKVFRGNAEIASQLIAESPELSMISGTVSFDVEKPTATQDHPH